MRLFVARSAVVFLALLLAAPGVAAFQGKTYVGVHLRDLTDADRALPGVEKGGAALSAVVAGGPAEKAGLKANDIIVAFGATPIASPADLSKAIQANKPGAEVVLTIVRERAKKEVRVVLGEQKSGEQVAQPRAGWKMPGLGGNLPNGRSVIVIRRGPSASATALLVPPVEQDALELLLKAEALEQNDNWIEAADIYQSLMEQMGDKVLNLEEGTYVGIRSWCERLVLGEPRRLKAYRENFDLDAERDFEQSRAAADEEAIRHLAARYALTGRGEEILAVAGMMAMERGNLNEAVHYMKRLCDLYPKGKWTRSTALPVLYLCGRESGNAGALRELREFASGAGYGDSEVTIDRKSSPIDALLAGASTEKRTSGVAGSYASYDDYFGTHDVKPVFDRKLWSKTPPPLPPPPKTVTMTSPLGWQIDLPNLEAKKNPMHPLTLAAGGDLFLKRDSVTAYSLADGVARENVSTDLFAPAVKTPGMKPWEADPERYKVKSNTIRHHGAIYLCFEFFDREHSFSQFSLCRIDETTGAVAWTTNLCSSPRSSEAPLFHALTRSENTIFVATNAGMIAAVEMSCGAILWIHTYDPKLPDGGGEVIVIDSSRPETMPGDKPAGDYELRTYPVLTHNGKVIFFPADQEAVFAVDARTGKLAWKFPVDRKAKPMLEGIAGDTLLISLNGVIAVNANDGSEMWRWHYGKSTRCGKGALTPDALYTPMADGVWRVNLKEGAAALVHPWTEAEAGTLMLLENATVVISNSVISSYGK